ncbi:phospholipase A [Variovorax terrae]|uniref:Phospholipase A1 n=1 Tax=Variovorax terrae TaxID=2923278 RepID=A0A9X1VTJ5_9BURK|nr:phospholipase A [Variovorax terrae]MCJ0761627.1 phospholipase A [Variovorax terrae]
MEEHRQRRRARLHPAQAAGLAVAVAGSACAALLLPGPARAQSAADAAAPGWQQCAALGHDKDARLACFDQWARQQASEPRAATAASAATAAAMPPAHTDPGAERAAEQAVALSAGTRKTDCRNPQASDLSRFWELEEATDCGTFGIRGYRPLSLSWIGSNSVNTAPSSPSPGHTASYQPYQRYETRIQLSVRTKIAQGLLTHDQEHARDSLWFGYTQQSYWQLFNGAISRPFRNTDHEPEIIYIYPTDAELGHGWRLRYSGIGAVHQSNGQSLPLSRSWNRVYLMAGMEKGDAFRLQGRVWQRLRESAADDDNPGISDYIGRAEVAGFWNPNKTNTFGMTVRHSLSADARGSVRLEWLRTLGNAETSGLRFHTQIFSGYGDSLVDYNRRRTVLSVGLSLVDF